MLTVIGSGPAGVACAHALAARGHRVELIDAGREAEPEHTAVYEHLAREWNPELAREARLATHRAFDAQAGGQVDPSRAVEAVTNSLKPAFGSLFPYADADPRLPLDREGVAVVPSLARGGLSNTWGAALLPFLDRDLGAWPIGAADLAPHYEAVLRYVPLAGERDQLEAFLPLHANPETIEPTEQICSLLRDLRRNAPRLEANGASFGRSRLAVWASGRRACRLVGLCMNGCPFGSIYNSAVTLAELVESGRVEYRPGFTVERIEERRGRPRIRLRDVRDGSETEERRDRVFVACGVLGSTRLILRSAGLLDRTLTLRDSQYYAFPLLRLRGERVSVDGSGNTLSQVFIDLHDPRSEPNTVHFSIYGFSELMLWQVARRARLSPERAEQLLQPLLGRLLFAQGYLHSDLSSTIEATLTRDGGEERLLLRPRINPETAGLVRRALMRLLKLAGSTRAIPVLPMLSIGEPGKSFHVGGAFPMSASPGELESDLLGRPLGWRRVHVVDASVFPSVPATTITFSAMANATRIGATFDED